MYSAEERARRDASRWTFVQGVLAPVQFAVMLLSAGLVLHAMRTGEGHAAAHLSVVVKSLLLYTIMYTGALWEHDVFGRYLFAPLFFWEDVVSMLVIALHTAYLAGLALGWDDALLFPLALTAYATYGINAVQFVRKLRMARRGSARAFVSDEVAA